MTQHNFGTKSTASFKSNDSIVCQIICLAAKLNFDILQGEKAQAYKVKVLKNTIEFVQRFMNFTNLKQVLTSVRHDLPALMGFTHANIYQVDSTSLFAVSLNEENEKRVRAETDYSFEQDYVFDESQIVRFPLHMGVNGFSHCTNSVNYFNNALNGKFKHNASSYQVGNQIVPVALQKKIGKYLSCEYPYNIKSDNFLDLSEVHNAVFASLLDEEDLG